MSGGTQGTSLSQAAYKKKDGFLSLAGGSTLVTWTAAPGTGPPGLTIVISNITNLQQTPDSSPKAMLKIFAKGPNGGEPTPYLFHFNSPVAARNQANAFKEALSSLITTARAGSPSTGAPAAAAPEGSASGTMAFSAAVNGAPVKNAAMAKYFDDAQLKMDIELQQSLMKKDRALHQTYMEARRTKPTGISDGAFNSQFWSTRCHLLRTHAVDIHQKKGAYNVLSTIKPKTIDGDLKLNMSKDQIQLILSQHPLVRRIFTEHVPPLSEPVFWSRFFLSRLSKQLRGERITDLDNRDALFDAYDPKDDILPTTSTAGGVPAVINVEANMKDRGGVPGGNRADVEMRQRGDVPVVRTVNSLSSKILSHVTPADTVGDGPTWHEIQLHDLLADKEATRIPLAITEQSHLFAKSARVAVDEGGSTVRLFANQDVSQVLDCFRGEAGCLKGLDLAAMLSNDGLIPEDTEGEILKELIPPAALPDLSLPPSLAETTTLTHATTMEFLSQFWSAYLSGSATRASDLPTLLESLRRSAERIVAVSDQAEVEREKEIEVKKNEIREYYKRTGKKLRWRADTVGGGRNAVLVVMNVVRGALSTAEQEFLKAVEKERERIALEEGTV